MWSEIELAAQRRVTAAFIAANPSSIVLTPRLRVKTGTGTTWQDQPPRAAQTFRLIDQSSPSGNQPTAVSIDGSQRKVTYQLLGAWTTIIGLYDYWIDGDGFRCEVAELLPDNGYEQRAQVVRYGQA